jgi:hypothetical protein
MNRFFENGRVSRVLLSSLILAGTAAMLPGFAFADSDCSSVGQDSINDSMVSNLEQQASIAEERAATARNEIERERWEDTARSLHMQAEAAQSRQEVIARGAQTLCNQLNNDANQ